MEGGEKEEIQMGMVGDGEDSSVTWFTIIAAMDIKNGAEVVGWGHFKIYIKYIYFLKISINCSILGILGCLMGTLPHQTLIIYISNYY